MGWLKDSGDKAARSPHATAGVQGAAQLRALDRLIELQEETLATQQEILAELRASQTASM